MDEKAQVICVYESYQISCKYTVRGVKGKFCSQNAAPFPSSPPPHKADISTRTLFGAFKLIYTAVHSAAVAT